MLTKDLQILMNCQVESLVPFLKGYTLRTEKKKHQGKTQKNNQDLGMLFQSLNIVR